MLVKARPHIKHKDTPKQKSQQKKNSAKNTVIYNHLKKVPVDLRWSKSEQLLWAEFALCKLLPMINGTFVISFSIFLLIFLTVCVFIERFNVFVCFAEFFFQIERNQSLFRKQKFKFQTRYKKKNLELNLLLRWKKNDLLKSKPIRSWPISSPQKIQKPRPHLLSKSYITTNVKLIF